MITAQLLHERQLDIIQILTFIARFVLCSIIWYTSLKKELIFLKKISIEDKKTKEICKDFLSGLSYKQLMEKHSVSQRTIGKTLKENGLSKRKAFTNKEKESMLEEMASGSSYKEIQEKYGITYQSLYQYAKNNELKCSTGKGRKNHFDTDYFERIDTPEKAYWFGFLYADGAIVKSNATDKSPNRLQINLSSRDRKIIENFLTALKSERTKIEDYIPKGTYSDASMSRVSLNSKKMCDDMIQNGFRLLKEQTNGNVFGFMENHLHRHFIRGVFDGDGSLGAPYHFSIVGQIPFLEAIQKILIESCGLNKTALILYQERGNGELANLQYGGRQIEKIYNFLYEDATQFLERKNTKFKELLNL